jgi:hypothetical protein
VEHAKDRMALVLKWAYALAATGRYSDYLNIQKTIAAEGFPEAVEWLDRPSVREALSTICATSRKRRSTSPS